MTGFPGSTFRQRVGTATTFRSAEMRSPSVTFQTWAQSKALTKHEECELCFPNSRFQLAMCFCVGPNGETWSRWFFADFFSRKSFIWTFDRWYQLALKWEANKNANPNISCLFDAEFTFYRSNHWFFSEFHRSQLTGSCNFYQGRFGI